MHCIIQSFYSYLFIHSFILHQCHDCPDHVPTITPHPHFYYDLFIYFTMYPDTNMRTHSRIYRSNVNGGHQKHMKRKNVKTIINQRLHSHQQTSCRICRVYWLLLLFWLR